jgi:hypothetical protein
MKHGECKDGTSKIQPGVIEWAFALPCHKQTRKALGQPLWCHRNSLYTLCGSKC